MDNNTPSDYLAWNSVLMRWDQTPLQPELIVVIKLQSNVSPTWAYLIQDRFSVHCYSSLDSRQILSPHGYLFVLMTSIGYLFMLMILLMLSMQLSVSGRLQLDDICDLILLLLFAGLSICAPLLYLIWCYFIFLIHAYLVYLLV